MKSAAKTRGGKMYLGPRAHADPPTDPGEQINELIDEALVEETSRQTPRGYLGGSRVGEECLRRLAYEYFSGLRARAAYEADPTAFRAKLPFDGRILRVFALGHILEDEVARLLRLAGFTLLTKKADGKQFGWVTAGGRMRGHADGAITAGPINLPYPLLWECKSMKASKWSEVVRNGVRKVYPVYYGQCQTYMAYLDLKDTMFTAYNKDTSELHVEIIPFDAETAQHLTDRAVRVLTANSAEELPRIAKDDTDFRCKFCPFKKPCWNVPIVPTAALPPWLKGK